MTDSGPGQQATSKVPAVVLTFWIIKIAATTLGETGGDTVTMTMNLGYLIGTAIFASVLVGLVWWQIRATRYHPFLYWTTIIASTTAGTTMADFADRSLGIGYTGGSALLLACLVGTLALWHRSTGSVSIDKIETPKAEIFYWVTITFSQTLGTALGDWIADTTGPGRASSSTSARWRRSNWSAAFNRRCWRDCASATCATISTARSNCAASSITGSRTSWPACPRSSR
jgi:uncharacterized membrane-anchored protein